MKSKAPNQPHFGLQYDADGMILDPLPPLTFDPDAMSSINRKRPEDMTATECLAEIFSVSEQEAQSWFAARAAREAEGWALDRSHQQARLYWGPTPLPSWSHFEGTIRRPDGRTGALIQLRRSNIYVQGNEGSTTSLDQAAIKDLLGR